MKRTIVINPEYENLQAFLNELPANFEHKGDIVQNRRNVIKSIEYDGYSLNIKRYRKPILINRFVYSLFRKPKAYKAYYNAIEVIKKGFKTPVPVAFIEEKECGLLSLSYFVSTQLKGIREIREYYWSKVRGDEQFLLEFARYTAKLHNAGVLHLDYSPGNILFSHDGQSYVFNLVDINRMQFREVDIKLGCENFSRLFEYDDTALFIAEEYAKVRGFDVEECKTLILYSKHQFEKKKERKKRFKQLFS